MGSENRKCERDHEMSRKCKRNYRMLYGHVKGKEYKGGGQKQKGNLVFKTECIS